MIIRQSTKYSRAPAATSECLAICLLGYFLLARQRGCVISNHEKEISQSDQHIEQENQPSRAVFSIVYVQCTFVLFDHIPETYEH